MGIINGQGVNCTSGTSFAASGLYAYTSLCLLGSAALLGKATRLFLER